MNKHFVSFHLNVLLLSLKRLKNMLFHSKTLLLKSIKTKNKLYKKYLQVPTVDNCSLYKRYKNKLNHTLRLAKRRYYEKNLEDAKSNKFHCKFTLQSQIHSYNTRNSCKFRLPFCRTRTKQFSVFYQGPKFCNTLNTNRINASSPFSFKRALKAFICNNY